MKKQSNQERIMTGLIDLELRVSRVESLIESMARSAHVCKNCANYNEERCKKTGYKRSEFDTCGIFEHKQMLI